MSNIQVIIWLFPLLFIFHDLEEIIFMQAWISKNRLYLCERFPILSKKLLPHFDNITTSSFAFGVAEEFILISIIF
ncbi:HXXEE domain-containing protein [Clostridium estertheticum]|uniref:HXXEE domain-containing protein n=1 Tax=Clostridium estertheticum TaxID=238834 RepID=UPI001CF163E1|nr:HXXEE domain-containing protein [Clostridium estertheticum]MCB2360887.1 HXXEE domain-containing protein [Clostridium estertheticum]